MFDAVSQMFHPMTLNNGLRYISSVDDYQIRTNGINKAMRTIDTSVYYEQEDANRIRENYRLEVEKIKFQSELRNQRIKKERIKKEKEDKKDSLRRRLLEIKKRILAGDYKEVLTDVYYIKESEKHFLLEFGFTEYIEKYERRCLKHTA